MHFIFLQLLCVVETISLMEILAVIEVAFFFVKLQYLLLIHLSAPKKVHFLVNGTWW